MIMIIIFGAAMIAHLCLIGTGEIGWVMFTGYVSAMPICVGLSVAAERLRKK